jgi:tripartite-type tricarboxylate transporter receptor subunit TctC
MKNLVRLCVSIALAFAHAFAAAQSWPAKPIKIIVPYPPGGTSDILARALGPGSRRRSWRSCMPP